MLRRFLNAVVSFDSGVVRKAVAAAIRDGLLPGLAVMAALPVQAVPGTMAAAPSLPGPTRATVATSIASSATPSSAGFTSTACSATQSAAVIIAPAPVSTTDISTPGGIVIQSVHEPDGTVRVTGFETSSIRGRVHYDDRGLLVEWHLSGEPGEGFSARLERSGDGTPGAGRLTVDLGRHGQIMMDLAPPEGTGPVIVGDVVNHATLKADPLFIETVALSADLAKRERQGATAGVETRFLRVLLSLPVALLEQDALSSGELVPPLGVTPPKGSCADSGPNNGECRDCCARQLAIDTIACSAFGVIPSPLSPLLVVACQALAALSYQGCLDLCDLVFTELPVPIVTPVSP